MEKDAGTYSPGTNNGILGLSLADTETLVRNTPESIPETPDKLGENLTPLPLAAAKKRLSKYSKRSPRAKLTEKEEGMAIGMRAVGVPMNKVAQSLSVPVHVINDLNKFPAKQDAILELRDKLKMTKMQKALFLEEKLWNLVNELADEKDAKGVDGVMRAIHASEKIQQAVAGESQKVEVNQKGSTSDLAGLIQVLIQQ
jgi:hypothetical protein